LFPPNLRNKQFSKCSLPIDECIFDNTFCDKIFRFPTREIAADMMVGIIDKARKRKENLNKKFRVCVCVDSLGKEEVMVFLAEKYKTKIVVNE